MPVVIQSTNEIHHQPSLSLSRAGGAYSSLIPAFLIRLSGNMPAIEWDSLVYITLTWHSTLRYYRHSYLPEIE